MLSHDQKPEDFCHQTSTLTCRYVSTIKSINLNINLCGFKLSCPGVLAGLRLHSSSNFLHIKNLTPRAGFMVKIRGDGILAHGGKNAICSGGSDPEVFLVRAASYTEFDFVKTRVFNAMPTANCTPDLPTRGNARALPVGRSFAALSYWRHLKAAFSFANGRT